nr:hypothetical protein Iba_chr08eCG7570 [Ipomoea batatas]
MGYEQRICEGEFHIPSQRHLLRYFSFFFSSTRFAPSIGPGQVGDPSIGPGLDESTLGRIADEIIYEAAMGHIERLAEVVMNEGESGQGMDKEESGPCGLMEYEEWIEKMKIEMGHDKEGINIIEGAKQEVMEFFIKAQKEFGQAEAIRVNRASLGYEQRICEAEFQSFHWHQIISLPTVIFSASVDDEYGWDSIRDNYSSQHL